LISPTGNGTPPVTTAPTRATPLRSCTINGLASRPATGVSSAAAADDATKNAKTNAQTTVAAVFAKCVGMTLLPTLRRGVVGSGTFTIEAKHPEETELKRSGLSAQSGEHGLETRATNSRCGRLPGREKSNHRFPRLHRLRIQICVICEICGSNLFRSLIGNP
jgi:hypothetical protein